VHGQVGQGRGGLVDRGAGEHDVAHHETDDRVGGESVSAVIVVEF
jgi:hypothetical protein